MSAQKGRIAFLQRELAGLPAVIEQRSAEIQRLLVAVDQADLSASQVHSLKCQLAAAKRYFNRAVNNLDAATALGLITDAPQMPEQQHTASAVHPKTKHQIWCERRQAKIKNQQEKRAKNGESPQDVPMERALDAYVLSEYPKLLKLIKYCEGGIALFERELRELNPSADRSRMLRVCIAQDQAALKQQKEYLARAHKLMGIT